MGWDAVWEPSDEDKSRGLEEAELVKRHSEVPEGMEPFTIARGWVGRSPTQGRWRIYLNVHLTAFAEAPATDFEYVDVHGDVSTAWIRDGVETTPSELSDRAPGYIDGAILTQLLSDRDFLGSDLWINVALTTRCPQCPWRTY